jgi:Kef-type K+ transport system membrane component KefB
VSFSGLLVVAAIAFAAPLLLGLAPSLRLPAVVLEIVAGIVIGPSVLDWVEVDEPLEVMSLVGLAFLLLLAGLEVDVDRFRGRLLRLSAAGFVFSLAIALAAGLAFDAAGLVSSPLLVAIMLSATALGIVIPVLKDSGEAGTRFGQLVIAGASIADVATIVLLSLFFSGESANLGAQVVLLVAFGVLVVAIAVAVAGLEHSRRLTSALVRLQDTTAQIRVRGAFLLLAVFVVLADRLGLEAILGAFAAGAVLRIVDRDEAMTHPRFRIKLEAAGFGIFVPFFFVTSGIRLDLGALFDSGEALASVPLFLAALLLARGVPALLFRSEVGLPRSVAGGLLQATSLGFFVVAGEIGRELGVLSEATYAALVCAGLASVILFPLAALSILRSARLPTAEGAQERRLGLGAE